MRHPDGSSYIGQMNNLYHGKGILTSADGSVKKGMFIKGEFKLAQDFNEDFLKWFAVVKVSLHFNVSREKAALNLIILFMP